MKGPPRIALRPASSQDDKDGALALCVSESQAGDDIMVFAHSGNAVRTRVLTRKLRAAQISPHSCRGPLTGMQAQRAPKHHAMVIGGQRQNALQLKSNSM